MCRSDRSGGKIVVKRITKKGCFALNLSMINCDRMLHIFFSDDALSSKRPVDSADRNMTRAFDMGKLNHGNLSCSDSRREDSESEAEGLALVLSKMEQ